MKPTSQPEPTSQPNGLCLGSYIVKNLLLITCDGITSVAFEDEPQYRTERPLSKLLKK